MEFCTVQALYEFPESAACLSPEEQNRRLAGIARPKTLSKVKCSVLVWGSKFYILWTTNCEALDTNPDSAQIKEKSFHYTI